MTPTETLAKVLKPCPFCGAEATLCQWRDTEKPNATWVECTGCASLSDTWYDDTPEQASDAATEAWNQRTALEQREWQPIETAPRKTGIEILAVIKGCNTGRQKIVPMKRVNESDCDWRDIDGDELSYAWDITHWMPLPAPPMEGDKG